jgi:NTP pyrophosphatase (non-canonical NTP hydrolase)
MSNKYLHEWCDEVTKWRISKEFYTPSHLITEETRDAMLGKLMLVVSELGEAAEAVRHKDIENFKEEIADTFIRLFDICGSLGIPIEDEINKKMKINWTRPKKHNKFTRI